MNYLFFSKKQGDLMKFIDNLSIDEYTSFINKNQVHFMQEPSWANVKDSFNHILCGVEKDNELKAVCQILIRDIKFGIKLFYIPRGYVMDLTDKEVFAFFTSSIKKLAKKHHAYVIKIDPNICINEYLFKDKDINFVHNFSNNNEIIFKNFIDNKFKHTGYFKDFSKTIQPRFNMVAPLIDENGHKLSEEEFLATIKSKHRQYLDKYHKVRGVSFEVTNDINRLNEFVSILAYTEKTQGIVLRNEEYFKQLMNSFPNRVYLIFGKIDLEKYLNYLIENNGKEEEITKTKEWLNKQKEMTVSTGLLLLPNENNKIKMSEYLYAGNNLEFNRLNIAAGVCLEAINLSIQNGCDYCNLGGVDGDFKDHLSIYKSKFNALVLEYIGEFDLVINKFIYFLIKIFYPLYQKYKMKKNGKKIHN